MIMKKILIVILVIDILLLLCYCGIKNTSDTPSQSEGATTSSAAVTSTAAKTTHPTVTTPATTVGKDTTVDQKPEEQASGHFSSYESILKLCRTAIYRMDTVNENPRGLADGLFGFDDSTEKEWFLDLYSSISVFHPGRGKEDRESMHYKQSIGYAIKDLNGDGVDELVLLTDEYIVIAIFSMADSKPVLLANYWERNRAWIDEKGWIHNNGSSGASYSNNTVYKVAIGGASFEVIAGFGTDGVEWIGEEAVTIYYKLVNGEKIRITEAEYNALNEQYGKYLDWDETKKATKEQAGLKFVSLFRTEADIAMEKYQAVLKGTAMVYDTEDDKNRYLQYCRWPYLRQIVGNLEDIESDHYAYIDLDGDAIKELVILDLDTLILRYYEGIVYFYSFTFRGMNRLYTDGSYTWSHQGQDHKYGEKQLAFDGSEITFKNNWYVVNDGKPNAEYYVGEEQVTKEEFNRYLMKHPKAQVEFTPEPVWDEDPVSFLSQDVKNTWKEDLITLLSQLDIWKPENSIYGSHAVGLMDLNFDNTPEVLVAYPGGSMGNVWIEIYDLKSHDEPTIFYACNHSLASLYVVKAGEQYLTIAEGFGRVSGIEGYFCIESLSNDLTAENDLLKLEYRFTISDYIVDGYGPYYFMGESVDKSKFDEEYQTFRNTYEVIRPTEMQMVMWSEFDLSNQEKAAREMANALVNISQQFIDYKN